MEKQTTSFNCFLARSQGELTALKDKWWRPPEGSEDCAKGKRSEREKMRLGLANLVLFLKQVFLMVCVRSRSFRAGYS